MNTLTPTPPVAATSSEQRIRERAYFLWLEQGSPHGLDLKHWGVAAGEETAELAPAGGARQPEGASPPLSIRRTVANHQSDPAHRFHCTGAAHDGRLDVVAGEARQRVRSRSAKG